MNNVLRMLGLGTLVLVAGCSSWNPFVAKVDPSNVPAALVDFKPSMSVRTVWSTSIGKSGNYVFSPANARNSIFAAAENGSISRISAVTGDTIWHIQAGMTLTAGVGTDGNTLAVAGEKGVVLAFDSDGKLLWKAQASSEILSAPAIGRGVVVVRSVDNRIAAYDVASGKQKWSVLRSTPALSLRSAPGMTIVGPSIVIAMPGGRLLSLSLENGGVYWEAAIGDPRGVTELERMTDVSGFPAAYGNDVCAAAYQGRVGCLDVVKGSGRWAKKLSSSVGVGIDEQYVYAADDRGAVYAFTRESGQSVWRNEKLANRGLSTPISAGRIVAVADNQGYVHFLSKENGAFVGRSGSDGSQILAAPIIAGSFLVFQTKSGTLFAVTGDNAQ